MQTYFRNILFRQWPHFMTGNNADERNRTSVHLYGLSGAQEMGILLFTVVSDAGERAFGEDGVCETSE